MELNERIFYLLKLENRTAKELGAFINVNPSSISAWKNEGSFPSSKYIVGISEFFNVSIEYLVTGEEAKKSVNGSDLYLDERTFDLVNMFTFLSEIDKEESFEIIQRKYERAFPNLRSSTSKHGKKSTKSTEETA